MTPFIRTDVWSLAPGDPILEYYADAVDAMQAKSAVDPMSWMYQAAIHGTPAAPPQPLWNECRHQSWYFLPWHRAYLYYFERIVRAEVINLGGPADWALPYWDYDGGAGRNALPPAFRNPARPDGRPNPLYVPSRRLTGTLGLPPAVTSSVHAMGRTLFTGSSEFGGGSTAPARRFAGQTGRLEQTPHNDVHNMVGGLMLNPAAAARDPVFWLHHCNIDRLWWQWQQLYANPTAPGWSTQSFSFFDVGGVIVTKTCRDVEDIVADLDYTYPAPTVALVSPPPLATPSVAWPTPWPAPPALERARVMTASNPEQRRELVGATDTPLSLVGAPVRITVPVDRRAATALARILPDVRQHRAFLEIESVDAEQNPGTVYAVYVNLPADPTTDELDAHHVGNVSLFGIERTRDPSFDDHAHALNFSMEITDVLNRAAAGGAWTRGEALDVSFRPLSLEPTTAVEGLAAPQPAGTPATEMHSDTPIRIGRISVHYQ